MVYLSLFSYILIYSYKIKLKQSNYVEFLITYSPIFILLIMIYSLQREVGTDYTSYYNLSSGIGSLRWMEIKNEILFVKLLDFVTKFNKPQLIFLFTSMIQVAFFSIFLHKTRQLGFELFDILFLYLNLTTLFFGQFNGIRQYISVNIINLAFYYLIKDDLFKYIGFVLVSSLFHSSSIYLLFIVIMKKIFDKRFSFKSIILFILFISLLTVIGLDKQMNFLLSYTPYRSYIGANFSSKIDFLNIATKIPIIVTVIGSIYLLENYKLEKLEIKMLNLGIFSLVLMIMSLSSGILWRFYSYIAILVIFPPLLVVQRGNYQRLKIIVYSTLFLIVFAKIIIFPIGEYKYKSILDIVYIHQADSSLVIGT